MKPHLLRYQGLVVDDYGVALGALNPGYPQLSLIQGFNIIIGQQIKYQEFRNLMKQELKVLK